MFSFCLLGQTSANCDFTVERNRLWSNMSRFESVRILYATVTGTSQDVACEVADRYAICNVRVAGCSTVDEYDFAGMMTDALQGTLFVLIVSTAGDGESPPCMNRFWMSVRNSKLSPTCLNGLWAAIFGLGDRSYPKFNAAARRLATRLVDLGASLIVPLGLGDESQVRGYDEALRPWMESLFRSSIDNYDEICLPYPLPPPQPKWLIKLHEPQSHPLGIELESVKDDIYVTKWTRGQIFRNMQVAGHRQVILQEAVVSRNDVITHANEVRDHREVRHIELEMKSFLTAPSHSTYHNSGLAHSAQRDFAGYEPGDVVNVLPRNWRSAVDAFLALIKLDGNKIVTISSLENSTACNSSSKSFGLFSESLELSSMAPHFNIKPPCRLNEFVAAQFDLVATPRRRFLERLAFFTTDERQKQRLIHLSSSAGFEDFVQYVHREKRTILMLLRDFPSARPPVNYLFDMLPRLQPRAFSIASSRQAHGSKLHICVAMVQYVTPLRFFRVGLCSSFFARCDVGDIVPIFCGRGSLQFDDSRAAICIGPGTGIAPMRSFISSLRIASQCTAPPKRVLFAGCRHRKGDYLYSAEWGMALRDGRLDRLEVAVSRDDPHNKVYVQDRMMACAEEVWGLLTRGQGGCIYLAGQAGDMPKSVRTTIVLIAQQEGQLTAEAAEKFVRRLEKLRRIQIECW